jgi:hypothetical protein
MPYRNLKAMKANVVECQENLINKGDIYPYSGKNGLLQLAIVCPGCGKVSASAGKHKYDPLTLSYHPSIVHSKKLGGCGWHGWLKNGEFTEC